MDGHQTYSAKCFGRRFPLPRSHIPQRAQIFEEPPHPDQTAGVSILQEFIQIAPEADMRGSEDGAVVGCIYDLLQQLGDRHTVYKRPESSEKIPNPGSGLLISFYEVIEITFQSCKQWLRFTGVQS